MQNVTIHVAPDLVEVTYRPDLEAVCLKWFCEYDEGERVRQAVQAALGYVREHGVRNWLADLSTSSRALSDADMAWVNSEAFASAIMDSPLRRFALIPPRPETGQDIGWLADWEANTLAKFGDRIAAMLSDDPVAIGAFFRENAD